MHIVDILKEALQRQASDIIISAGAPVTYHVFGRLEWQDSDKILSAKDSQLLVYEILNSDQRMKFELENELDMSFHIEDICRFRVNVYRQRSSVAAVLRLVPFSVPNYVELGISERLLIQMTNTPNGLILITGPTGAGKSSTVASFLEYLNTEGEESKHIITIEDPIEFMLSSKTCVIDQRELGADTSSYARGLRSALRQMPHIIFVGEMRDRETMEIALTAAETGNLVISTLSTQSSTKTINRIIDVFPNDDQAEIRGRLALTLRMVVSQVLLRRQDQEGRIAAREILIVNSPISNLIREGKIHQLTNIIAGSYSEGMILLDSSLLELYNEGIVSPSEILPRLEDPEKMRLIMGKY